MSRTVKKERRSYCRCSRCRQGARHKHLKRAGVHSLRRSGRLLKGTRGP